MELPLICASGSFKALKDMTNTQMETFITFLVQCSYGLDNIQNKNFKFTEPLWWLPNLFFVYPFRRPTKITSKWTTILRKLIISCYRFHNLEILLDVSCVLANSQRDGELCFKINNLTVNVYRKYELIVVMRYQNYFYDTSTPESINNNQTNFISSVSTNQIYLNSHTKLKNKFTSYPSEQSVSKTVFLNYFHLVHKRQCHNMEDIGGKKNLTQIPTEIKRSLNRSLSSVLCKKLAKKLKSTTGKKNQTKNNNKINKYLETPANTSFTNIEGNENEFPEMTSEWTHKYKFRRKFKLMLSERTIFLYKLCKPCKVKIVPLEFTASAHYLKSEDCK